MQTPRTYAAILRGAEKRMEREMEVATFGAWQVARMTYYGGTKLRPLKDWLKELQPARERKKQTNRDILAALRATVQATMGSKK